MRRLLAISMLLSTLAVRPARAQHGFWQPDERVLITSFHNALSVATDQRYVFVATSAGLEIYDQSFQRWLPPSTIEDGYPVSEGIRRIAYDPRERGIWLQTLRGFYTWSPFMQRWQQRFDTEVPAEVRARLANGLNERDPALAIMRNFAGRDALGRTWQVSGIAAAERPGTYWASTLGGNFAFVDTRNLSAQGFTYGTLSSGTSAIAVDDAGHIYFGSAGNSQRSGVTRADTALQKWEQYESVGGAGPRHVNDLLAVRAGLYAAAHDGVYVLRSGRWQRVTDVEGAALAYAGGRIWVATRGTLGWIDATDHLAQLDLPVQTFNALAVRNDSLWVAAASGLFVVHGDRPQQVSNAGNIDGVAVTPERVVVVRQGMVHTWDGAALSLPLREVALQRIGGAMSISAAGSQVYIGGTQGVAEWDTRADRWRYLTVPADVPVGPVYDVATENGRVWLATPAGALRLQWK